ncbi:MAG TPA: hypothetical protein VN728_03065 [Stellaceae bacterium]|jgi:hypothetical protein|nr:hypothetical protein [Stellaceae bacterium]
MAEKERKAARPDAEKPAADPQPPSSPLQAPAVLPPNWAPDMVAYADVSRMLFRMHRNVAAHMDAHKRLAQRMQSVFAHEQAMVLELARLIDQSMGAAQAKSGEEKSPLGGESMERIFDHARNAMQETGRMLTEIQLESLALLEHYIKDSTDGATPSNKGTDKK